MLYIHVRISLGPSAVGLTDKWEESVCALNQHFGRPTYPAMMANTRSHSLWSAGSRSPAAGGTLAGESSNTSGGQSALSLRADAVSGGFHDWADDELFEVAMEFWREARGRVQHMGREDHRLGQGPTTAEVLRMSFIHIPRTGGISLKSSLPTTRSKYKLWYNSALHRRLGAALTSPWHLPPDVYERTYGSWDRGLSESNRPNGSAFNTSGVSRFCIVRSPANRLMSAVRWTMMSHKRLGAATLTPPPTPAQLLRAFNRSRQELGGGGNGVEWTATLLLTQPQHWFVWDDVGRVQCHCVIAFEKLWLLTSRHLEQSASLQPRAESIRTSIRGTWLATNVSAFEELPAELRALYAKDQKLWEHAGNASGLCYEPG